MINNNHFLLAFSHPYTLSLSFIHPLIHSHSFTIITHIHSFNNPFTNTHQLIHSPIHTQSLSLSLIHRFAHTVFISHSFTHSLYLSHSLIHSLTHSSTDSFTHPHPHRGVSAECCGVWGQCTPHRSCVAVMRVHDEG